MNTPLPLAAAAASVLINGQPFEVAPAKLPQLLRVIQLLDDGNMLGAAYAVFDAAKSAEGIDPAVLLKLMNRHGEQFVQAFAALLRLERAQLDELDLDELLLLFAAAVEVNLDFFTQRLMTKLSNLVETISTPQSGATETAAGPSAPISQADPVKA